MPTEETFKFETLNLRLDYTHEHNIREKLMIGVVPEDARGEDGTISLVVMHWPRYGPMQTLQFCLNEKEIDLVIKGLSRARQRLRRYRLKASTEVAE